MSTEAASSPEMAKKEKKKKKDKSSSRDHDSKKRKLEEAPQDRPSESRDDKRSKKRRKDSDHATSVPDSQPGQGIEKKHKKHKDKAKQRISTPTAASEEHLRNHPPFVTQTTSFYLPLSSCAHNFPLEGLCAEHISPLLLTYYPPLSGVLLSYSNPRISEHPTEAVQADTSSRAQAVLGRSINEYAVTYVWLTADFILFRPRRGCWLEGYVSVQNESLLGLVCYNYFNAVIERDKLPKDWRWEGEEGDRERSNKKKDKMMEEGNGYFVTGAGEKIDSRVVFRVLDFEANPMADGGAGTISMTGTLLTEPDGS